MQMKKSQKPVYQLKIKLRYTDPPVWRRFAVSSDVTLHRLHLILQEVMGWNNSHLYRFKSGSQEYGELDVDDQLSEIDPGNSKRVKLENVVTKVGNVFLYEYDFGDSWIHDISIEAIQAPDPSKHYPICLAGERACPPEDCGGPPGFSRLLSIMSNPDHDEYRDMIGWLGRRFYPTSFSLINVNRHLGAI